MMIYDRDDDDDCMVMILMVMIMYIPLTHTLKEDLDWDFMMMRRDL